MNPWYRSLMKIHQHWAEIFNKMCTSEVSNRDVTPHFDCLIKRIPVIDVSWKSVNIKPNQFNKTYRFEVSIGLFPVIEVSCKSTNMELRYLTKCALLKLAQGCYPSFWLSHEKNPCYGSLMKISQHGAEIFNKLCTFEVSIGLLTLILIISSKESLV